MLHGLESLYGMVVLKRRCGRIGVRGLLWIGSIVVWGVFSLKRLLNCLRGEEEGKVSEKKIE